MRQITTLTVIHDDDRVLLAMKKRGFGEGLWNGYGGKVQEGETVEEAMIRELEEESGLIATDHKKRAVIDFVFDGNADEIEMHVFEIIKYDGELIETEEMAPKWFSKNEIPFDQMWPDDKEWFPLFFEGKNFRGRAVFDAATNDMIETDFREVSSDSEIV